MGNKYTTPLTEEQVNEAVNAFASEKTADEVAQAMGMPLVDAISIQTEYETDILERMAQREEQV